MTPTASLPLVVAITGASGAPYAVRLVETLLAAGREVHLSISPSGQAVIGEELSRRIDLDRFRIDDLLGGPAPSGGVLHYHHHKDLMAPIASGSFLTGAMVICPCSGSTLGAVAHSMGENLIHRAAEVHLKERRKLVVVPRETPLSLVHLRNLTAVTEAGAVVMPAAPGFYHKPAKVEELVDFMVQRMLDHLGLEIQIARRWEG